MALSLPTPLSKTFIVGIFFGWINSVGIFLCLGYLGQRYMRNHVVHPLHTPTKHEALPTRCQNCLHIPTKGCRATWTGTDPNLPQTPEKTDPWRSLCSDRVSLSPESPEKHTRFSDTTKTIFSCDMLYHKLSPCPMPLKLSSVFLPLPFHSVSQLPPAWLFSCLNRSIGLHRSLLHVFP